MENAARGLALALGVRIPGRVDAARLQDVHAAGPVPALADDAPRQAPEDRRGSRPAPDTGVMAAVFAQTVEHWRFLDGLVWPQDGWLCCPACRADETSGGRIIVRGWQYHVRPGAPTIPWRCDVFMKCPCCAMGWWHGVAIPMEWWIRRDRPDRKPLIRSNFEPMIWNGNRGRTARRGMEDR